MNFGQTVAGQRYKWNLVKKLGEGDAGETYLVESGLEARQGILKRPRRSHFSSDIFRQAAQIRSEGNILKALSAVPLPNQAARLSVPALLDQSLPEDGFGERFFIVMERAPGIDLKTLRQLLHYGPVADLEIPAGETERLFIDRLLESGEFPPPVLIRALAGLLDLLEAIHFTPLNSDAGKHSGVVWNDVKPEHLFWDPSRAALMVIDWGNSQFLEPDGTTKDRRYSHLDDDNQFIQEIGAFLAEAHPGLYASLEWPQAVNRGNVHSAGTQPLRQRLADLIQDVLRQLKALRLEEASLYGTLRPRLEHLERIESLYSQLAIYGELPDYASALNFHARVALQMLAEQDLPAFQQVCQHTARLKISAADKWDLLAQIAALGLQPAAGPDEHLVSFLSNALAAGIADDWPAAFWELFESCSSDPLPAWWDMISQGIRRLYLKVSFDTITPFVAVSRLYYTLQSAILQMEDKARRAGPAEAGVSPEQLETCKDLLRTFNEEVVKKWKETEPAPPNSGLDYRDVLSLLQEFEPLLPGTQAGLEKVLAQPRAQAEIVLDAWESQDFETARRALRTLLLWDPDRRRLKQADRAIASAQGWLARLFQGSASDEPFYDYLTAVELDGRRLRNQVGRADWLDLFLDVLKRLRKGTRHVDLMMEHPEIIKDIPWLSEHRSREILQLPRTQALRLERGQAAFKPVKGITGVVEGRLGTDQDLVLAGPLDAWVPEARGSSARVFSGHFRRPAGMPKEVAIKIMRPDRADYALPLFREEAQILAMLRNVPGVTPLIECGFMRLADGAQLPPEEGQASAAQLRGQLVRYGIEEVQNLLASMDRYLGQGWLPYLALVKRDHAHNLMVYCDAGYTHGWFLPLRESLLLAIQICDILQVAHDRNIVYRDHKILHYYWDPEVHGVMMIDWNIAKRLPQGLTDAERHFDLAQFGARALHHILTGRPAPGALPLGPNRPEDIERSALSYTVSWTYDDERLPNRVKEILAQVLSQGYTHIREVRQDLEQVFQQTTDSAQAVGTPNAA